MPGVHKCKHISYLFSLLVFHPSSASFTSPLPSSPSFPPRISLPSLFSCVLSLSCFYLSVWVSPSLTHLASSLEFYLRGVTSPEKLGLSWEESNTTKQNNRDGSNIYSNSGVRREIKSTTAEPQAAYQEKHI